MSIYKRNNFAVLCAVVSVFVSGASQAQQPRINTLFPIGGRAGETVEVEIRGAGLAGADKMLVHGAGVTGTVDLGGVKVDDSFKAVWQGKCASCHELRSPSNRSMTPAQLTDEYPELVRALRCAAPGRDIDESVLLRGKLAAALGAIFQSMEPGSSDAQIETMAISVPPAIEGLFTFHNASSVNQPAVRVELRSKIFNLTGFPLTVARKDNLNEAVGQIQPG